MRAKEKGKNSLRALALAATTSSSIVRHKMQISITKTEQNLPSHVRSDIFRESGTIYKMYITTPLFQYNTSAHMTALVSPLCVCVSACVCVCVCVCVCACTNMIFALRTLLAKLKIELNRWGLQYCKNAGGSPCNERACLSSPC